MIEHRAKETSLGHSEILAALYYIQVKFQLTRAIRESKMVWSFNGGTASSPNLKLMHYVRNIYITIDDPLARKIQEGDCSFRQSR